MNLDKSLIHTFNHDFSIFENFDRKGALRHSDCFSQIDLWKNEYYFHEQIQNPGEK